MLVIAGEFRIDAEKRDEAVAAALEMMAATRDEEGCVTYVFSADLEDPAVFRLFEEWETAGALEDHFASEHMAQWRATIADFGIEGRVIHRYEVSSVSLL
jgi:quinol monooxygenase YgiN